MFLTFVFSQGIMHRSFYLFIITWLVSMSENNLMWITNLVMGEVITGRLILMLGLGGGVCSTVCHSNKVLLLS